MAEIVLAVWTSIAKNVILSRRSKATHALLGRQPVVLHSPSIKWTRFLLSVFVEFKMMIQHIK